MTNNVIETFCIGISDWIVKIGEYFLVPVSQKKLLSGFQPALAFQMGDIRRLKAAGMIDNGAT